MTTLDEHGAPADAANATDAFDATDLDRYMGVPMEPGELKEPVALSDIPWSAGGACYLSRMSQPAPHEEARRAMTLEEWADLGEDEEGELVDGYLEEEEMPTTLHETIAAWLFLWLLWQVIVVRALIASRSGDADA